MAGQGRMMSGVRRRRGHVFLLTHRPFEDVTRVRACLRGLGGGRVMGDDLCPMVMQV